MTDCKFEFSPVIPTFEDLLKERQHRMAQFDALAWVNCWLKQIMEARSPDVQGMSLMADDLPAVKLQQILYFLRNADYGPYKIASLYGGVMDYDLDRSGVKLDLVRPITVKGHQFRARLKALELITHFFSCFSGLILNSDNFSHRSIYVVDAEEGRVCHWMRKELDRMGYKNAHIQCAPAGDFLDHRMAPCRPNGKSWKPYEKYLDPITGEVDKKFKDMPFSKLGRTVKAEKLYINLSIGICRSLPIR